LTRCLDALTESWRWIHTVEDAGHAESDETARWTEIPAGFSVGVRRHAKDTRPDYQVTIDSTGAGRWHGVAHVREIGDRTFAVPPGQMLLLANRARRIIGLGHDITLRYDEDSEITVFVHAAGTTPGPREERFWSEQQTKESTANSKAAALGDLIDVFARTSHFAGSWDEQQAAHDETAQAPK
jgi:hypothetical protein